MVLKAEPLARAVAAAKGRLPKGAPVIGLSAHGQPFDQGQARRLSGLPGFALVAGRYEGIDQRASDALVDEELSIGDYVLSGGEFPALIVIDAVVRLLPGVLGDDASAQEDSFGAGLLDWPHYTRPEVWDGRPVPPVLLGGNHAAISALAADAGARPHMAAAAGPPGAARADARRSGRCSRNFVARQASSRRAVRVDG